MLLPAYMQKYRGQMIFRFILVSQIKKSLGFVAYKLILVVIKCIRELSLVRFFKFLTQIFLSIFL